MSGCENERVCHEHVQCWHATESGIIGQHPVVRAMPPASAIARAKRTWCAIEVLSVVSLMSSSDSAELAYLGPLGWLARGPQRILRDRSRT